MADLTRIKQNVAKMVEMGAPESDIDQYISEEGTSVEAIRNHKEGGSYLPEGKGNYLQMMGAIPETAIRGALGLGGQIWGGLAGALEGAATGKPILENASKVAGETAKALTPDKTLFAPTDFLEKEVISPGLEWVKGKIGEGAEQAISSNTMPLPFGNAVEMARGLMSSPLENMNRAQAARTAAETASDVLMATEMIRGPGRAWERRGEARRAAAEEQARKIREASEPQYVKSSPPREPLEFTRTERPGLEESVAPIRGQDKSLPFEETPFERPVPKTEPLPVGEEFRPQTGYESLRPNQDIPLTERTRSVGEPTTTPGEFLSLKEEPKIASVPYEPVYPRDGILNGMESNLSRQQASMERMRIDQDRLIQEVRDGKLSESAARQEISTLNNRMSKLQKTIDRLSENITKRRNAKEPTLGRGPGRRQQGAINPEVFREGFEKGKDLVEKGLKLVAYATRDEYGPVFRISARDKQGAEVGSADFIPTRGGLKRLPDRDLLSAITEVDPQHQRKGIATEMYKFAHELGNDVVPSPAQTAEGKAMWKGFEAKGVPLRQRGAIAPDLLTAGLNKLIRRSPKDEPKVQIPDPNKRQSLLDMASNKLDDWKEFWRKEGPELRDLPNNPWSKSIEYFSNAQMLYHDTKNPMVKWLADTIANEKALADLKHQYGTQGIQFESKGSLLPKKIISPDSPYSHWIGLSQKERQLVTDIINKYSGEIEPTPDMMRAMGANQKVINALETLQQPIKEVLSDINKQLIELGRNPIKERPFYFMRNAGQGNWLVRVKNKTGETLAFTRTQTKGHGESLSKSLLEKLKNENPEVGDLKTEVVAANDKTRGNKYNVSTTLLEDIYQALERNDPRREVLNSAIADIKSKGGYGAHRAFRKGVQGMENTPKEFWKTYEKYIQDGYNYESGQRLANLRNQIELTTDIPPGLKTWSLEYLDRARGGEPKEVIHAIENGLDRVLSTITGNPITGDRFQTTNGAMRRLISKVNYGFTTQALFFYKIPFLAGQALQSTSFAPAVMSLYKNHGYTGSVGKAMLYGSTEMFNKSPEFTKIVDYLSARGKIDQALVHDMGFDFMKKAAQTEGGAKIATAIDWATGRVPAQKLEALNRVHSAAIGYHFLKDQLKGNELRAGVERFVDDVMGNYGTTDRPGIVTRHGIVGDAVAPLGTFANWYKGMTAVMLKEAAQGIVKGDMSKAAPFVTMWLSTALMAGVMAAPLMKEIDWVWNAVKGLFGFNEKTPSLTEAVLTSGLPDTAKFGALTGATTFVDPRGMHITGSMAAPEIMPGWIKSDGQINWKNAAPGLVWAGEAATGLMQLATDVVGLKKLSVEARRQALKDVFPSQFDAWFSNLDTTFNPDGLSMPQFKQGQPILSKTGQGTVRRNDDWDTYASLIGSGTIPEVTEKMVNRDIKREGKDLGGKRGELVQQAVDAIMYGTGDLDKITKQAMEIGYTNFDKAIQQAYQERLRTEAERSVGRGTTLQQYENHQYIKRAVGQ